MARTEQRSAKSGKSLTMCVARSMAGTSNNMCSAPCSTASSSENFARYIEGGDDGVNIQSGTIGVITPEIEDDAIKAKDYFPPTQPSSQLRLPSASKRSSQFHACQTQGSHRLC